MSTETRTLPLWKDWVETAGESMGYGSAVTTAEMAKALECAPESIQYAMAVHEIRKWFRRRGMNFTARGQNGTGFVISPPETNVNELHRFDTVARSAYREAVILGTTTPLDLLDAEARRRLEGQVEKMAKRLALITRAQPPQLKPAEPPAK